MGRRTVAERVHHEPEPLPDLLLGKAQGLKHGLLDLPVMDTHRAAAQLHAVQHHVVSLGPNPSRFRQQILYILGIGHGKGMVCGHPAVFLLGELKLGEVRHQ